MTPDLINDACMKLDATVKEGQGIENVQGTLRALLNQWNVSRDLARSLDVLVILHRRMQDRARSADATPRGGYTEPVAATDFGYTKPLSGGVALNILSARDTYLALVETLEGSIANLRMLTRTKDHS